MHTLLLQEVLHGPVLELGTVVREENFGATESEENLPTYWLSNIIYKRLKNCIALPHSHINNSFEIKNKLKNIHLDNDHVFLSLDVKSLFTKIPIELVCDSIDRQAQSIVPNYMIPLDVIKNCVYFLYDNTYFTFNNKYYRQIFGTPMGSAISPFFADIVMDDLEKTCLERLKSNHNSPPFSTTDMWMILLSV